MNHRRNTLLLILAATVIRLLVALTTELGNDEVYYRLYANPLQWNYFDHPPMVGWLIRLTTLNLWIDNGLTIRLGAIICGAWATWLMYACGKRLSGAYTGFLAAALYTATIYGSIIAGTFILPDSPQMVCWIAALYLLIKITASKTITTKTSKDILWFGLVAGIGMLCKIHTIFLWVGLGLYVIIYNRTWLSHWVLYAAAGITLLFILPIIIWNIQNNFVTFFFHGKRVNVAEGGLHFESLLTFIGGQILYCNPIVFFTILYALWHRHFGIKQAQKKILLLVSLPLIFIATGVSLFKDLLPHWTGPAFASLLLLTAAYFAGKKLTFFKKPVMPIVFSMANVLLLLIVVAGMVIINFLPGTFGKQDVLKKGEDDFTLDMYGWRKFAPVFDSIYHSTHGKTEATNQAIIVTNKWFPAAHIDFYVGQPLNLQTVALGPIEDIHQYHWLNQQRGQLPDSTELYMIIPSNYYAELYKSSIVKNATPLRIDTMVQNRGGKEARKFYVYHYKKDKYNLTAVLH